MKNNHTLLRAAGVMAFWLVFSGSGALEGQLLAQVNTPAIPADTQIIQGDTTAITVDTQTVREDTTANSVLPAKTVTRPAATQPQESALEALISKVRDVSTGYFPQALGALLILLLGWLLAVFVSWIVRSFLKQTGLDEKLSRWTAGEEAETRSVVSGGAAKGIFYLIMLFVVVAVLQTLELTVLTGPINLLLGRVFEFIPQLVGAILLFIVAWIIANVVRFAVTKVLSATRFDERIGAELKGAAARKLSASTTVGNVLYWITFLVFLPAILGTLGIEGIMAPVQGMLDEVLAAVPNVLAAMLIFFVGWFVARIVSRFIANLLSAIGTDRTTDRAGMKGWFGGRSISQLIGTLVYALIVIPVAIAALNTLQIDAISRPAIEMLATVMGAVPSVFAAGILIVVAYIVARILKDIVSSVLAGIGFNSVLMWLGFSKKPIEDDRSPSEVASYIVLVAILLFAVIASLELLGFTLLADTMKGILAFGGRMVLALLVFGIGLFLANLAHRFISGGGTANSRLYAQVARYVIIVFVGAMALRELGIADDIINLAFGILLGAVAVTFAIAFGVGSRDIAANQVEKWMRQLKGPSK